MKALNIHPEAVAETKDAAEYYEAQQEGLGRALRTEVDHALSRLQTSPQIYPPYRRRGFRKCFVARFQFMIYFREFSDTVWVAAIAHGSRRPGYWHHRRPGDR